MNSKRGRRPVRVPQLSKAKLALLVEEATVDAYNDDEQAIGLFTMDRGASSPPVRDRDPRSGRSR